METQVPERRVEFNHLFGDSLNLLSETLEGRFQLLSQLSLSLLCMKIVTIVHVLMFAQICCDLTDFSVKLDINVLLFAK